jgi:hypothetical protein
LTRFYAICIFLALACFPAFSQQLFRGVIYEGDSSSVMPFVYVINKNTGNGTMSDNSGKFYLNVNASDTLMFSFVGFVKMKVPVIKTKPNENGEVKIVMRKISYNLSTINVTSFKIKPYEREKMEKVIKDQEFHLVNAMESPITALYNQFSKRGKEQRKLAKIFEDVFIQEQVNKKLNAEILRKLTGDEKLDYEKFRKFCYTLSDYYILNHDGYDLYYKVMECYYRWKDEGR